MTEPNYAEFFRTLAVLRARLLDPEPLDDLEREALAELLNGFEEMMVGTRNLVDRISAFDRAVQAMGLPPLPT